MMAGERLIRLRVLPRGERRSMLIQEGATFVNYEGGEQAEVSASEAIRLLATGNFALGDDEQLADAERLKLDEITDPLGSFSEAVRLSKLRGQ
jgi:hypothetical protein